MIPGPRRSNRRHVPIRPPRRFRACSLAFAALACAVPPARGQPSLTAELVRRYPAPEASQGVAADRDSLYAVGNSEIARYDKATGRRTALWSGDPKLFPHLNSCAAFGRDLVCAGSNYPATPMRSRVEIFDRGRLAHKRSIELGEHGGSLTWVTRRGGLWWACLANYDGRGGEPGRDHAATTLAQFDARWRRRRSWRVPKTVLDRLAPRSASGGVWSPQGLLYVSGHDSAEVYVLRLPAQGDVLEHVATIAAPIEGQAIALDPADPQRLYGVSRGARELLAMRLPKLAR